MENIKYGEHCNNCYFYNNRDMYDIKTKKVVDVDPIKIDIGDMVYYFKSSEFQERLEKVMNEDDSDEIKSRKLFVVFNLVMKDKWLKYISWDKLQDIIFFDSRNTFLHRGDIEKDSEYWKNHYNDIFTSKISINPDDIYVICKVNHETGDHYYIYYRIQTIIEMTRQGMGLNPEDFTKAYWKLKMDYLTKKSGNNIMINFTEM